MTTFNAIALDDYVVIEDIRGDIMPPIDVRLVEGALRSYNRGAKLMPRIIEMDVRLIDDDHEGVIEKAKQLAKVIYTEENKQLITRRRPNEFIMAMVSGSTPINQLLHTGQATLNFLSDEGIYYSNQLFENLSSGTNNGTLEAKPVLKFTATSGTHSISNGLQSLFFEGLTSGDVVEIDTVTGKITVNGGAGNINEVLTSRSDLFVLPVGPWSLTGATATYRERSL